MIIGRYVRTFAEADLGMLDGVSLNAPYPFFWLENVAVDGDHITCTAAGKEMRLPIKRTRRGDQSTVTVPDPIFGPLQVKVLPFKRREEEPS